jgi:DegV family protein with EDD domain
LKLITNPGSNLTDALLAHYEVELTPQHIHVDGVAHDTRGGIARATIDEWVRAAKVHPYVLGTSAAEFVEIFKQAARADRELVAIMTSKKIVGSYTAAVSAARALGDVPGFKDVRVAVIDTESTDLGAGFCTMVAGDAIRVGMSQVQVVNAVERFAKSGVLAMTLGTLDYLVKGGRASFLRAWLANLLDVTPLITFASGELHAAERVSRSANVPVAMADFVTKRVGAKRRVWMGISHGGDTRGASALAREIRARLDVVYEQSRELQSSIYLNCGPGALGVFVYPVDEVGFELPVPPTS